MTSLPQFGAAALGWHGHGGAAAGTAAGRDSSPGAWGGHCLQPVLRCPGVLSRHLTTRGPEDLLPTSVLPGGTLSPCTRGSEAASLSLYATARGSVRYGLGRLRPQRYVWMPRQDSKKPSRICRAGGGGRGKRIHPHVQHCQARHLLSSDPAGSSATSLVGWCPRHKAWLAPSQLPQRHYRQLEKLTQRRSLDSMEGLPIAGQEGVTHLRSSRNTTTAQSSTGSRRQQCGTGSSSTQRNAPKTLCCLPGVSTAGRHPGARASPLGFGKGFPRGPLQHQIVPGEKTWLT